MITSIMCFIKVSIENSTQIREAVKKDPPLMAIKTGGGGKGWPLKKKNKT